MRPIRSPVVTLLIVVASLSSGEARGDDSSFDRVAEIFSRRCISCHRDEEKKGDLSLQSIESLNRGGEGGPVIVPGKPDESTLIAMITPSAGHAEMPKDADALTEDEQKSIRDWIVAGVPWPKERRLESPTVQDTNWWSLKPIASALPPVVSRGDLAWAEGPIDLFIASKQEEKGLRRVGTADRRTLGRRLSFDLLGLPPDPDELDQFITDDRADAYERLVDRYLASCHHGERWARHWLDVVHFGETHGYDKDKPRPHAWPYRDYVVRSLNADKPYRQFIEEQIAGDVLYPDTPEGVTAMGFLSAGPWDLIGHEEVPESKIDGKIARHLDRDDMVATTINTFCSMTVQCAQCHHHKFDPITQEDYYRLHAVFAAIDRTNRPVDADPAVMARRSRIERDIAGVQREKKETDERFRQQGGADLEAIEKLIQSARASSSPPAEHGYHSQIEATADRPKWVQVDLGESTELARITLIACHDDFAGIGDGFGYPKRFRIDASDDPEFVKDVKTLVDRTGSDVPSPGCRPQEFDFPALRARYVRVTATVLAPRQNDFIFALGELIVESANQTRLDVREVTALDSIEAPPRWRKANLVDGKYSQPGVSAETLASYQKQRESIVESRVDLQTRKRQRELFVLEKKLMAERLSLPAPALVYSAGIHTGSGAFSGTGGSGGEPRPIHLLSRGDVKKPGALMEPGGIAVIRAASEAFDLPSDHREGDRRAALARWITSPDHPLTWRSIVNRVWLYHFGHGIVDTPNDFGRMGDSPSHPELLDWLAREFQAGDGSWKSLHRSIVTSGSYRLSSADDPRSEEIDLSNRHLWRMSRRRMEAEELRDAILWVAGDLDLSMEGPSFQDFIVEKPEHSPHYQYHLADLSQHALHRRSIYRFLVRSQQQPWMATMDGADPSILVDKRNETVTPLQALALWNNELVLIMARRTAECLDREFPDAKSRLEGLYRTALGRRPTEKEESTLAVFAAKEGWEKLARIVFNLNEFVFVE